jgi:hypothetical protein
MFQIAYAAIWLLMMHQGANFTEPEIHYDIAGFFDDEGTITDARPTDARPTLTPPDQDSNLAGAPLESLPEKPFITKQALKEIRAGIAATIRPSFQAGLPANFGCKEHGKLKADQWRTAMEFDIPISLVKILADYKSTGNLAEDKRARRIVEHTLDLAMAMTWGFSRRTSEYHAERYQFYMTRYLAGIHELYPHFNLKPNHHYALHLGEILKTFGPLHGTWAFAFERLNGRLRSLNSNFKIGTAAHLACADFAC